MNVKGEFGPSTNGNILVRLLQFCLLLFCLLNILLLFASIYSIVIKFRFTKVLLALVELLGEHPLTSYDIQLSKSKFLLFLEQFLYGASNN